MKNIKLKNLLLMAFKIILNKKYRENYILKKNYILKLNLKIYRKEKNIDKKIISFLNLICLYIILIFLFSLGRIKEILKAQIVRASSCNRF